MISDKTDTRVLYFVLFLNETYGIQAMEKFYSLKDFETLKRKSTKMSGIVVFRIKKNELNK